MDPGDLSRLLRTVAVPYLVFEAVIAGFRFLVGGERLDLLFVDPHWPMWYLAALFLWRLATPLLRSPGGLAAAVAVSLLGGLSTSEVLDTSRATGLLPFFVLGLLARPEHVALLQRRPARVAGAAALAGCLVAALLVPERLGTEWLYWRSGYAELGVGFAEGAVLRLGLLLACALTAAGFLALVPRRGGWFSRLGAASLVVYLFHGFAVLGAEYAGFPGWAATHPTAGLVLSTAASVALALALAAPPVARRLQVLVDPVGGRRRRSAAPVD